MNITKTKVPISRPKKSTTPPSTASKAAVSAPKSSVYNSLKNGTRQGSIFCRPHVKSPPPISLLTARHAYANLELRKVIIRKNNMDDTSEYLVDEAILGQFIDELIKRKPLAVSSAEELAEFRTKSMHELDDRILQAVLSSLTEEQGRELDQILDSDTGAPEPYQEFFAKNGIDVEKLSTDVITQYAQEFLGGQHA